MRRFFGLIFLLPLAVISRPESPLKTLAILKSTNLKTFEKNNTTACVISQQVLRDLAESIRNILTYVPQPQTKPLSITEPSTSSRRNQGTACDTAKSKLQSNIDNISTLYLILLTNSRSLSEGEFERLKKIHEDIHRRFNNDVKIINTTFSFHRKEIEEVIQENIFLETRLEQLVRDLDYKITTQKRLKENTIRLIAADIKANNIKSAKEQFLAQDNPKLIYDLVDQLGDRPNCGNFINFLKGFSTADQMRGLHAMLDKKHIGYWIFALENFFKALLATNVDVENFPTLQNDIDAVRNKLPGILQKTVSDVTLRIATKNVNNFKVYLKFLGWEKQLGFDAHLEEIVENIYRPSNSTNREDIVEQIIEFSGAVPFIEQAIRISVKFFKLMEQFRDRTFSSLLRIGYRFKFLLTNRNYPKSSVTMRTLLEATQPKLPTVIKSILWGRICLKNEAFDRYIQGTDPTGTLNAKLAVVLSVWEFETVDRAKSFLIRNVFTGEFLSTDERKSVPLLARQIDKRTAVNWEIEYFGSGNRFLIRKKGTKVYLNIQRKLAKGGTVDRLLESLEDKQVWILIDSQSC